MHNHVRKCESFVVLCMLIVMYYYRRFCLGALRIKPCSLSELCVHTVSPRSKALRNLSPFVSEFNGPKEQTRTHPSVHPSKEPKDRKENTGL